MSDAKSIFLTNENLAFSLPLIAVVSIYVYFKLVPTKIALSLIAGAVLYVWLQKQVKAQKDKKLTTLDEDSIRELIGEEEKASNDKDKVKRKQIKKQKKQVQARLSKENGSKAEDDDDEEDDDDDADLGAFAKASKVKKR